MWLSRAFSVVVVQFLATNIVPAEPAGAVTPAQIMQAQNDTQLIDSVARLAIAWVDADSGVGMVRGARAESPWTFDTPVLETGPESTLRVAGGLLYVVSRAEGTVTIIDADTWITQRVHSVGAASEPLDIAIATP